MPTRRTPLMRKVGLAGLGVAIALSWSGCTTMKSIVAPPPAPKIPVPAPPSPITPAKEPPPPAPVKKEPEPPPPPKKEPEAPPVKKEAPPAPPKAPVTPPAKEPPPPAPAKKEPEAPPPVLAPQVGKGDEEQLRRTASSRIQRAEQLLAQMEGKKLTGEQQEQLLTVQSLLGNSREAMAAQDLAKASNLAEKARILAEELSQAVK